MQTQKRGNVENFARKIKQKLYEPFYLKNASTIANT